MSVSAGMIYSFRGHRPALHDSVFVAPTAVIIGDVTIGEGSSVWFGAVLRGDVCPIRVGRSCNIQDNAVLHGDEGSNVDIADNVTVGHRAIIHGCKIDNGALIGMGAIVLDGAYIGAGAFVGAGALVGPGKWVDAQTLWLGCPARKVRDLDDVVRQSLVDSSQHYRDLSRVYASSDFAIATR